MPIYWKKRKRLHKRRFQLPEDLLGTPIYGRHDVTSKCSITKEAKMYLEILLIDFV